MSTSVETIRVDLRTGTKFLGAKEKKEVQGEILTVEDGLGPCDSVERPGSRNGAHGKAQEEADFLGLRVEASERICRSRYVRDPKI